MNSLIRRALHRHPQSSCLAVTELTVDIGVDGGGAIVVAYRIVGDMDRLRVPSPGLQLDPDRLWEHTCCEMFVRSPGRESYVEWNFSPTGQLRRFEFSSYRRRTSASAPDTAALRVSSHPGELQLEARIPVGLHPGESVEISLTTVIEDAEGALSYWAMRHPLDRPDFHHRHGFALGLSVHPTPTIVELPTESP